MLKRPERNPLKIIWLARNDLLPVQLWRIYFLFIFLMSVCKFIIPNNIIDINLGVYGISQYILLSISALTFVLSLYTFGQKVYSMEDFARFYTRNNGITYYKYLANYLFPAILWLIILICSMLKLMMIVNLSILVWDILKVFYLSLVLLAILSTIYIVVSNMNRGTNKVYQNSEMLIKELKEKEEVEPNETNQISTIKLGVGKLTEVLSFTVEKNVK